MNKTNLIMAALLPAALLTSCSSKDEDVIEASEITVTDGRLTPEILQQLASVGNPTVSPDGKKIAFTVGYQNIEKNKGNTEIYIMNADGSDMQRLTHTAASEANLQWIEGGEKLAYLSLCKDTDKRQIFVMNADGTDQHCVSEVENGIDCFVISPDGKKVVFGSMIKPYDKDKALFEGLDKTSGRLVNDLMYKHWDQWVEEIPHPFVADFSTTSVKDAVDIMEGEPFECPMLPFGGAESFAWSPDSKSLVYVSRKLTGKEYSESTDSGLYLYELESKKTTLLTEGMPGYDTDPQYSPDGKTLAWLSMPTAGYESDKKRLMVMDVATGAKRDLTENWDWWPEGFTWSADSAKIYFHAYYMGTEPLFCIDTTTAEITNVTDPEEVCDYASVAVCGNGVVTLRHSMVRPNEIYFAETGAPAKALTDINGKTFEQLDMPTVAKELVPTTDGKEMTVWVVRPPKFDESKQYPALLYCQGGPQQAVSQFWSSRWNFALMATNGYVVIAPNRRGVPGFGTEWNEQISGDYGGQNMQDYLAAVDYMNEKPYIDSKHVGACGASYGGFSVYWLAGHHEGRFAALIAHAGMFNLESQYLETEEMWFVNYDLGGAYWDKQNATAQRTYATSPHLYVDKWTAPILVTVGELDYRILASQGMQAFNAAKLRGLEAEMLVFPDENHWILQPQNAILWQRVFFNFLEKYLKPQDIEK